MIKKSFLLGLALLAAWQFVVAQTFQMITLSADGQKTICVLSDVQKIVFENNDGNSTMTVNMKNGDNVTSITRISFAQDLSEIDYSKLKLNEVSGVGGDSEKFYELINIGDVDIPLEGCQIFYNANGSVGETFPPSDDRLTWTGVSSQTAKAGQLFALIGRNDPGSFTLGITPERILIITLKDPAGNIIDQCIRAEDTGIYATPDRNQSFSRIPDGTGPFYFTTPTPDAFNGTDVTDLLLLPQTPTAIKNMRVESLSVFPNPVKEYLTLKGVKKDAVINLYDLKGGLLQTITAVENSTNIDVSSLQHGTYLLSTGEHTIKFVKQ